jgi:tRNA(Ile)-lysidine synthase
VSTRSDPADSDRLTRPFAALRDQLPEVRRYHVAFSGGLDSTVLLHLGAHLRDGLSADIHAVHVDHGLHPDAAQWAGLCEALCARLDIPLVVIRVDARAGRGESPEAAARAARYAAIAPLIGGGDCLLTAHHEDDQAETVLLQLLRGAGPHGLAAMPFIERYAAGWHARPLLGCARDALRRYAMAEGLQWIDDPSNADTGLRRNFLRHEILPLLKRHWPAAARTLSRSAAHSASAARLLDALAQQDLAALAGPVPGTLSVAALAALVHERQANALRAWLHRLGLPLPSTAHIARLHADVLAAAPDAKPLLAWTGAEIRRYRDRLYAMPPLAPHDPAAILPWDVTTPLALPGGGRLMAVAATDTAAALRPLRAGDGSVTVRFRQGGERCRPAGRGLSSALKKLFQEAEIPPWLRDRVPLVHVGDNLAAVAGICVCEGWQAAPGEGGLEVVWEADSGMLDAVPGARTIPRIPRYLDRIGIVAEEEGGQNHGAEERT